jgi:hypothetical protein
MSVRTPEPTSVAVAIAPTSSALKPEVDEVHRKEERDVAVAEGAQALGDENAANSGGGIQRELLRRERARRPGAELGRRLGVLGGGVCWKPPDDETA